MSEPIEVYSVTSDEGNAHAHVSKSGDIYQISFQGMMPATFTGLFRISIANPDWTEWGKELSSDGNAL